MTSDDDEMTVNVNGGGGTNDLKFFRFRTYTTLATNTLGYKLVLVVGAKEITNWKVISIARSI